MAEAACEVHTAAIVTGSPPGRRDLCNTGVFLIVQFFLPGHLFYKSLMAMVGKYCSDRLLQEVSTQHLRNLVQILGSPLSSAPKFLV